MADGSVAVDWPRLKRLGVEARLTLGDEITLEEYAEYHGLSADAVQTRAQNGHWGDAVEAGRQDYEDALREMRCWAEEHENVIPLFMHQNLGPTHLTYCIDVFLGRAGRRRWEKG